MHNLVAITTAAQVSDLALGRLYDGGQQPSLDFLINLLARPAGQTWAISGPEGVKGVVWYSVVEDEAEIIDIRVAQHHRRRGLGELLLAQSLEKLRLLKIRSVFLEVKSSNDGALALYTKLGFEIIGRRHNYYETPSGREDALTMSYQW